MGAGIIGLIAGLIVLTWGATGLAQAGLFTMGQVWNLPGRSLADEPADGGRVQVRGHQLAHRVELCLPHGGETGIRRGHEPTPGEPGHLGQEGPSERVGRR